MTDPVLPPGLWHISSPAGDRWLRTAVPVLLPRGAVAAPATVGDVTRAVAAAPGDLRAWWRLAEAAGWAWTIWLLPGADRPDGWTLRLHDPAGAEQRYTWVRHGERMPLVAQAETGTDRTGTEG
jgi:hypothetical protein